MYLCVVAVLAEKAFGASKIQFEVLFKKKILWSLFSANNCFFSIFNNALLNNSQNYMPQKIGDFVSIFPLKTLKEKNNTKKKKKNLLEMLGFGSKLFLGM